MFCASDIKEETIKFSCKGIQKDCNNVNYQKFHHVLFNKQKDRVLNKGFRYVDDCMKSYEQNKKGHLIHITRELFVEMVLQQNH